MLGSTEHEATESARRERKDQIKVQQSNEECETGQGGEKNGGGRQRSNKGWLLPNSAVNSDRPMRPRSYNANRAPPNMDAATADAIIIVVRTSARLPSNDTAPAACGPNVAANVWSGPGAPVSVTVGFEGSGAIWEVALAEVAFAGRMVNGFDME